MFKSAVRKSNILTLEKQNKILTLQKICTCLFANTLTEGGILRLSQIKNILICYPTFGRNGGTTSS
jgi:non-ribosomal peptide synthetase component F